jgi:hypothetical protein
MVIRPMLGGSPLSCLKGIVLIWEWSDPLRVYADCIHSAVTSGAVKVRRSQRIGKLL